MKDNFSYYMPTKIIFGNGLIYGIDEYIDGRKTILITSNGFVKRGLVDKIKLRTTNIVNVVTNIKSHPNFKDLEKIYNKIYDYDFELILAIGGGSVIDAAKFFSIYNDSKEASFVTGIIKGNLRKQKYNHIPIISVPTTAGTGSEVTSWATIWDTCEKHKYSLHLPELFSEMAIYDPILTLSVSKKITIQTGLDALSHALESIWNKNANQITIDYAIKSAKIIIEYLPKLTNDLNKLNYRTKIMEACMYAGLAFSNTQSAIAHAVSYYVTLYKGVDHGIACSFTLPMFIDKIIGKYKFIDNALIEIFGELSSDKLRSMLNELDISTNFIDYAINNNELLTLKTSLLNYQRANNSLVWLD